MMRPGRILERDDVATPRGSPVTLSKGMLPGIVHFRSDLKELRPSFWISMPEDFHNLTSLRAFPSGFFRRRISSAAGAMHRRAHPVLPANRPGNGKIAGRCPQNGSSPENHDQGDS
jgi:hypothetical protein